MILKFSQRNTGGGHIGVKSLTAIRIICAPFILNTTTLIYSVCNSTLMENSPTITSPIYFSSFQKRNHLVNRIIEFRYAVLISLLTLLWLILEYVLGLQDRYIAFQSYVSLLAF